MVCNYVFAVNIAAKYVAKYLENYCAIVDFQVVKSVTLTNA